MTVILSTKYAVLYGQVPMLLVMVDLFTSFMFALPILFISITLDRLGLFKSFVNSIAFSILFFLSVISYTIYSANQIGLTQKIGGRHVFDGGEITLYGLLVFCTISFALALALWFALYRSHKFYRHRAPQMKES